ncbi:MAG: hypothetical protein KDA89_06425 [Planctomycetaceae bacterium]|nr:hypothetical protein [Planctomycetaceae bacterium]
MASLKDAVRFEHHPQQMQPGFEMSLRLEKPGTQVAVGKQLTTNNKHPLPLAPADPFHNQQHNPFNNAYRNRFRLNGHAFEVRRHERLPASATMIVFQHPRCTTTTAPGTTISRSEFPVEFNDSKSPR